MRGLIILGLVVSIFYVGAMHAISTQLKGLVDFYSNEDQISSSLVNSQDQSSQIRAQEIKKVLDSYTSIF